MDMIQFEKDRASACGKSQALMVEQAGGVIVIADDARYEQAGPVLVLLRDLIRKGREFFADTVEKAHAAHKATVAAREAALADPVAAERKLNQAIKDYIVIRNRRQAEADKKIEDARIEAAAKVEESGDVDLANAMINAPVPKAPPPPPASGLTPRANWKARLIVGQHPQLVEFAAHGHANLVEANMVELNRLAKDQRREGPLVPGVECFNDPVIAGRRF